MKRIFCIFLTLTFVTQSSAFAICASEVDYMQVMMTAAIEGDWEMGLEAQFARNLKIDEENLDYEKIAFEDLYLVSKIMYAEAGSYWLSDDWKMCVGEVVLNRVQSPEFPNTVAEVLYQEGQYYGTSSAYFTELDPDYRCVRLATKLLQGERILNNPTVVFQANFQQGSGVYLAFYDETLGWTYFCHSNYVHMYVV